MDGRKTYSHIKIPPELKQAIEDIICAYPELGYSTNTELVKEAIRLHLAHIRSSKKR